MTSARFSGRFFIFLLTKAYILYILYIHSILRCSQMDIIISNSGGAPIYEQISSQIKAQIISGALREGDALPSIRLLAKELRISVITTKRAYEELEREGYVVTFAGKGSFVAGMDAELLREENLKKIEALLTEALELGHSCGLDAAGLAEMLKLMEDE